MQWMGGHAQEPVVGRLDNADEEVHFARQAPVPASSLSLKDCVQPVATHHHRFLGDEPASADVFQAQEERQGSSTPHARFIRALVASKTP